MRRPLPPWVLPASMLLVATTLAAIQLCDPVLRALAPRDADEEIQRLVLVYATLPRLVMALLCGAGLSLAGAILQQVLRNPLASPDTVALSAGARLALAITTLVAPGFLGVGRDLIAIGGAAISTAIVLLIARSRQYAPLALILAGLVVSLYCGASASILILLKDRYLAGLFIWGGGSLSQQSWQPALGLAVRLSLCLVPLVVLMRPLALLEAGEQTASSLGIAVARVRVYAIAVAVSMSACITGTVGVIGFVGLAGPILTGLGQRQRFPAWCFWSAVNGALLLIVTDLLVQSFGGNGAVFLPTGAVTAIVGAPLLLFLLPRLKAAVPPPTAIVPARGSPVAGRRRTATRMIGCLALVCAIVLFVFVGRSPEGAWSVLQVDRFAEVLPWRVPRMLGSAGAGALLALAGYCLQRITGNPMASPEIMGVSAGAILGAATTLLFTGSASVLGLTASTTIGSFAALVVVLSFSARAGFSPERVLLAGVALTALVDALVGVITASGDPISVMLLAWISGSPADIDMRLALAVMALALVLPLVVAAATRWLTILPLGKPTATGIGVPVPVARGALLVLVAIMTAAATPVIGPLTFVGLVAPHIAGLLGIRHVPSGLLASGVIGASLMMLADALARTIAFPIQLPTGILAGLLAGPLMLLLLSSGRRTQRRSVEARR